MFSVSTAPARFTHPKVPQKETPVKTALRFLNPSAARARLLKASPEDRRERGFSLIETMAAMAIVAILALAIVPQFGRYMERAAVQNVIADIDSAHLMVDADYALTGKVAYVQANVAASVAATKVNTGTTLTATVNTTTNSYKIDYSKTAGAPVQNYTLSYDSNASVLTVTRVS